MISSTYEDDRLTWQPMSTFPRDGKSYRVRLENGVEVSALWESRLFGLLGRVRVIRFPIAFPPNAEPYSAHWLDGDPVTWCDDIGQLGEWARETIRERVRDGHDV